MKARAGNKGTNTVVYAVTRKGRAVADRVTEAVERAVVIGPDTLRDDGLARSVAEEFASSRALVFVSAAGIAVRMIAPHLRGKAEDPAIVVIDDAGRFVISLLSGHLGGANELAETIARAIGATPVITTATDSAGLPCAEDIAKAFDLAIEDTTLIKAVNSAIVEDRPVVVVDRDPNRLSRAEERFAQSGAFAFAGAFPEADPGDDAAYVLVTELADAGVPGWAASRTLVMRPRVFVLGIGCRRGVEAAEIAAACSDALASAGISPLAVRNIATVDVKNDEAGLVEYAAQVGAGIEFFTPAELDRITPPSGESDVIRRKIGCGGVSETAAMISAGADDIWRKKTVYGRVTVAISRVR